MSRFDPTLGAAPTDKYNKARQDAFQAIASFRELDFLQRRQLVKEVLASSSKSMSSIRDMLRRYL